VVRLDELNSRAALEYSIAATLIAAGAKSDDGSAIEAVTPEEQREEFDRRLSMPLDEDRIRAAIMREVTA
jgi:hypothetical protein